MCESTDVWVNGGRRPEREIRPLTHTAETLYHHLRIDNSGWPPYE